MKKKFWKIAALVLAVVLIAGLLWFANALNGNPISKFIARNQAEKYIAQQYPGTDYELERVSYNFKDGNYHAYVVSPTSMDTHFTLSISMVGKVYWDTHENVTNKFNTAMRLEDEYRDLVDTVLYSADFPYVSEIGYGTLAIYPAEAMTNREQDDIPDYAMDQSELVLDGEYDIRELAARCGHLVIYVESETVTVEEAAQVLRTLDAVFAQKNVPFAGIDLVLWMPKSEDEPWVEVRVDVAHFRREWIAEEDLVDRVSDADAARKAWYEEQDKLR